MEEQLNELCPKEVFGAFYKICKIPHGTYNIDKISLFLYEFAKERNLEAYRDKLGNVIMIKEATAGYENEPPIIIQGHMDMVAVKDSNVSIDLKKDALHLKYKDGFLFAEGTSLGGDDGIAVAYAMALVDSNQIAHPRLEIVITVNEEVGMDGARGIDVSMLQGKRMLNIDSEEEGILTTSCAGGVRVHSCFPVNWVKKYGTMIQIALTGLNGGHSGTEIHKMRGNADKIMGRILLTLLKESDFELQSIDGGLKDNAIPNAAKASIVSNHPEETFQRIQDIFKEIKEEYQKKEDEMKLLITTGLSGEYSCMNKESQKNILTFLCSAPNGVMEMSAWVEGLVETSLNLGILHTGLESVEMDFAIRSSVSTARDFLKERVILLADALGGKSVCMGEYPAWEYKADSKLRQKMMRVYESRYGQLPKVTAVHAGLECGLLAEKIKDLDCISFGPNLLHIHTTKECMDTQSVLRTWDYLLAVLREKDA